MSIINPNRPAQTVEQAADNVINQMNALWNRTVAEFKRTGNATFWAHPKFTPMQIAAALGNRGVPVFQTSSIFQGALEAIGGVPVPLVPEGYTVTPNADGSVTITPPPTPEPEAPVEEPNPTLPGGSGGELTGSD